MVPEWQSFCNDFFRPSMFFLLLKRCLVMMHCLLSFASVVREEQRTAEHLHPFPRVLCIICACHVSNFCQRHSLYFSHNEVEITVYIVIVSVLQSFAG